MEQLIAEVAAAEKLVESAYQNQLTANGVAADAQRIERDARRKLDEAMREQIEAAKTPRETAAKAVADHESHMHVAAGAHRA